VFRNWSDQRPKAFAVKTPISHRSNKGGRRCGGIIDARYAKAAVNSRKTIAAIIAATGSLAMFLLPLRPYKEDYERCNPQRHIESKVS